MRNLRLWAGILVCLPLVSCAEITPPTPGELARSPFGRGELRVGMSKDEVRLIWGEPDYAEPVRNADGTVDEDRERWTYEARFPGTLPADVGYATHTKRLEFEHNTLVVLYD